MFERLTDDRTNSRTGRLTASFVLSTLLCGGAAFALTTVRPTPEAPRPREIDVALKAPPRPVEPPASPPLPTTPAPAAPAKAPAAKARPAAAPKLVEPTTTPLAPPPEADPVALSEEAAPSGPASDGAVADAPAPPTPPPPAPPVPEPVRASSPVELPEDAEPATPAEGNVPPTFPEEARAKGLEGVVILKLVAKLDGTVGDVRVLKGDEPFVGAAIAAVRSWRYSPALVGGQPVASYKVVKIPFRIR